MKLKSHPTIICTVKAKLFCFVLLRSLRMMAVGVCHMPWLLTSVRKAIVWHAGRGPGCSKREWHVLRRMQHNSMVKYGFCSPIGSLSRDEEAEQSQEEVQDVQKDSEFTKLGVDARLAVGSSN